MATATAQFDALNRLTNLSENNVNTAFAYDNNGNLLSETVGGTVQKRYEYDTRDQLKKVFAGANTQLAQFDYDFQRHRTSKQTANTNLHYVYAGDEVVDEFDSSSGLLPLQNRYELGAGEVVKGELRNEPTNYYFSDALGSTTNLSQTNGTQSFSTSVSEYDSFGKVNNQTGASANAIGYTGQRLDTETGLMALGNGERYYSPALARFTQQDSVTGGLMMPQSLNRYSYVHNNPFRFRDPSGNEGVIADWLHQNLTFNQAGAENSTFAQAWNTASNFTAGAVYDSLNLISYGTFGQNDRNLQKSWRGEQPTFSDILKTNWYGGEQAGWNPGGLVAGGIKGAGQTVYHGAVGLAGAAIEFDPFTSAYYAMSGQLLQRRAGQAQAAWTGIKQWGTDLYTGVTNPSLVVEAADKIGADQTAQIVGAAGVDAALMVDGAMAIPKLAKGGVNLLRGTGEAAESTTLATRGGRIAENVSESGSTLRSQLTDVQDYSPIGKAFAQETPVTCVAASCRMILDDLGIVATEAKIADALPMTRTGVSIEHVPEALEKFGVSGAKFKSGNQIVDLENSLANGDKLIVGTEVPELGYHAMVLDEISNGRAFLRDPAPIARGVGDSVSLPLNEFKYIWNNGRTVTIPKK